MRERGWGDKYMYLTLNGECGRIQKKENTRCAKGHIP